MIRTSLVIAAMALLPGCLSSTLSNVERGKVERRYFGKGRQLNMSMVVTPFFRDDSRRLLLNQLPEETVLVVTPRGATISPGAVQEVLPAGTAVHVREVSFPSAWNAATRIMTPAERTWVELSIDERKGRTAYVLALRPDLKDEAAYDAEVGRFLTEADVGAEVRALPEIDQQAIKSRVIVPGVSQRAVELALGPAPWQRILEGEHPGAELSWRSDNGTLRTIWIKDGKVEKVEAPVAPKAP